ncbi:MULTISPECIES: efflux transporter outer membrane subunit [Burkholderia]|uniref:Multidrug transporter n=1 Tax=Burkholderia savannae TaxID=1637837 RepID=A0ABR5T2U5_9BURK|nr:MULTISPECIES: efflux transporter outer membrane subunit [Burkholderia]AOJ72971.1 multidrug transporter [Burkholderia savannae]AOK49274.1 multidrug transporter [Burkholderia sp. MSMB617WGS]KGR97992.1 outer membrane protein oprM [Burkholderia sp. ABCPW 111]KVG46900.1 multidrug transporter [Burkholderia sp. MSMB0265]KVG85180.1 multidrug transporter [Burkholderia sp. MSMB2040]
MKFKTLSLACAIALSACSLDPAYQRPASPVEAAWPAYASDAAVSRTAQAPLAADVGWRDFFKDARLQRLIALALDNNRDLRVAALNVAEYEAQYRIARANLAPAIDASGSLTRERALGTESGLGSSSVSVGTTSWEIDFFGRLRSLKRQALEQYLATDASRTSTQISLIATVATDYLQWLADGALLKIAADTVAADRQTLDLTMASMKIGNASLQDVRQAQNSLASARASLASYTRAVEQDLNNLVAAIGCPLPDDLPPAGTLESRSLLEDIGAGVPSDLLARRPDIVEAEHTLKAANANIGAARAAFFPKIALTASAGTSSSSLSGLFKAGSGAWTFAPTITMPIFDYGSNKASLDVAKIEKDIDIADYEKAIQTAFKEVANALVGRETYVEQVAADREYVASAQEYYALAQARYRNGTDSFLTLLDAQRTLYTAQQQLVTDLLAKQSNLITLYKALGGGWSAPGRSG